MLKMPRPGTVVRVLQLGTGGHTFSLPAYALVWDPERSAHPPAVGQASLEFLVVHDRERHQTLLDHSTAARGAFCAPPAHLAETTEDEASMALALYALNGDKIFVNGDNENG